MPCLLSQADEFGTVLAYRYKLASLRGNPRAKITLKFMDYHAVRKDGQDIKTMLLINVV